MYYVNVKSGDKMTNSMKKIIYLLGIIDKAEQPVGKTYIQKGIYLLQEGLGKALDFAYKIHFYGPYSQELTNLVDVLDNVNMIEVSYLNENMGYKIELTQAGKRLFDAEKGKINISKIDKVSSLISVANVRDLELLSTVLYFSKIFKNRSEIRDKVMTLKPHFNKKHVNEAIEIFEEAEILKF